MIRSPMVNRLVDAALDGMSAVKGASGEEIFSAVFTLTLRVVKVAVKRNYDMTSFREGLKQINDSLPRVN